MSWDISIQHLPDVASIEDIPHDFIPQPLGARKEVISRIQTVYPEADFANPSWGRLDTDAYSIEFNMGDGEPCEGIMLHIRGGGKVLEVIEQIVQAVGSKALDCQTGEFFKREAAEESFEDWKDYRDRVVGS